MHMWPFTIPFSPDLLDKPKAQNRGKIVKGPSTGFWRTQFFTHNNEKIYTRMGDGSLRRNDILASGMTRKEWKEAKRDSRKLRVAHLKANR